ncbi:hypothetical protein CEXT_277711 [Caerostris extrusa]|uniref:Uncharacterized protein n=1 Tax=Caerostris extrusa TaxID=172846 RepID=A0AAV4NJV6_CAEEX|nr:hypothetical protein CEXT_277711 [Caerostris extrusa]
MPHSSVQQKKAQECRERAGHQWEARVIGTPVNEECEDLCVVVDSRTLMIRWATINPNEGGELPRAQKRTRSGFIHSQIKRLFFNRKVV